MELRYTCPKCEGKQCDVNELRATGGIVSQLFDVQNKHFTTVSCQQCSYTEMYRVKRNALGSVFDFLAGAG